MTEDKFKELVNLYLDQEISQGELGLLRRELGRDQARRREFESQRRLHLAMCAALKSSGCAKGECAVEVLPALESSGSRRIVRPVVFAVGLAACFSIAFVVAGISMGNKQMTTGEIAGGALEGELPAWSEAQVSRAEVARFLARQFEEKRRQATLTAQLRLLGLSPDILPERQELNHVDLEALERRLVVMPNHTERLERLAGLSPLPETTIIQLEEHVGPGQMHSTWPSGFKSSLAGFK